LGLLNGGLLAYARLPDSRARWLLESALKCGASLVPDLRKPTTLRSELLGLRVEESHTLPSDPLDVPRILHATLSQAIVKELLRGCYWCRLEIELVARLLGLAHLRLDLSFVVRGRSPSVDASSG
jgi:hypothetical protein